MQNDFETSVRKAAKEGEWENMFGDYLVRTLGHEIADTMKSVDKALRSISLQ